MRELAGLAIALAACYSPSAAVGVPCGSMGECPSGQHCNFTVVPPTCEIADARPIDAAPDAPPTCETSATCDTTAPVCDQVDHICRGCIADTECADDICLEYTGQCHNASNTLFVATTGANNGSCTKTAPCSTMNFALSQVAQNRRTIAVADGVYTTQWNIQSSFSANQLVISGPDRDPAGVVVTLTVSAPALFIENSTKDVLVEGISFNNGLSGGIDNRGTLTLSRVAVENNAQDGIQSLNQNSLAIWDSRVVGNLSNGIDLTGTTLELLRSFILNNDTGGLDLNNAATTIENCVIADNGTTTSQFGGVRYQTLPNGSVQVFRFNTLANNVAGTGAPHGVLCPIAITLDSSIFADTAGVTALSAMCAPTFSLFSSSPPPSGMNNIAGDPSFASATDFHITATSPAREAANPAATTPNDLDGERRPQGGMFRDIGADEVP